MNKEQTRAVGTKSKQNGYKFIDLVFFAMYVIFISGILWFNEFKTSLMGLLLATLFLSIMAYTSDDRENRMKIGLKVVFFGTLLPFFVFITPMLLLNIMELL
ncbi:hypothetical protein JUJ52_03040 [Virgibacillus sp. AGTR]|uniref:hypothetical protein n=1 Tax=Virgibacillus sp. AGTR TaxID=2812055 RepID=UPI001D1670E7|nr:hypothetical protein [Virgibacillus sp. AGTR]MCC2248933.1 hypothetical protein [Virgibacillus sp. AGTR]